MSYKPKNTSPRSAAARVNGAKSRGPATPAGRARSSRNSLRHGLAAPAANLPPASVVLPTESRKDFQVLLNSHLAQFHPAPGVETELVHVMASARWRLRRLQVIETTLLGNEMVSRAEYIASEFEEMDQDPSADDRLAYVFKKLADGGQSLALLVRYEGALNRSYDRAFKQLHILQSARTRLQSNDTQPNDTQPNDTQPNEPRPQTSRVVSTLLPPAPAPPILSADSCLLTPASAPPCDNRDSPPQIECPTPLSVTSLSLRT